MMFGRCKHHELHILKYVVFLYKGSHYHHEISEDMDCARELCDIKNPATHNSAYKVTESFYFRSSMALSKNLVIVKLSILSSNVFGSVASNQKP